MPYVKPTLTVTTETPEILPEFIRISRWRSPDSISKSRTATISPTFSVIWGVSPIGKAESRSYTPPVKIKQSKKVSPNILVKTQSDCNALLVLPLERNPEGRLLYQGESAKRTIVNKGTNVNLVFDINGYRLDYSVVTLEFLNLLGKVCLHKEVDFAQVFPKKPMGENAISKEQNWIGEIYLSPNETSFVGSEKYTELRYRLCIGNKSKTRFFVVEEGQFYFK